MTRKQLLGGIVASLAFWGFLALIVVTNGWALVVFVLLLIVAAVFAIGVGSAA